MCNELNGKLKQPNNKTCQKNVNGTLILLVSERREHGKHLSSCLIPLHSKHKQQGFRPCSAELSFLSLL